MVLKEKVLYIIVTIIVLLCGALLYALNAGAAAEFQQLYDAFGVNPPKVTTLLFDSLNYWWAIMATIALFSYVPLLILKGTWQYLSILNSVLSLVVLVGVVYAPTFKLGALV